MWIDRQKCQSFSRFSHFFPTRPKKKRRSVLSRHSDLQARPVWRCVRVYCSSHHLFCQSGYPVYCSSHYLFCQSGYPVYCSSHHLFCQSGYPVYCSSHHLFCQSGYPIYCSSHHLFCQSGYPVYYSSHHLFCQSGYPVYYSSHPLQLPHKLSPTYTNSSPIFRRNEILK